MFDKNNINNKSYTGCSNDMIALKLHRYAETDVKVLIMFTYPERFHITRKGCNFIIRPDSSMAISDNSDENRVAEHLNSKCENENRKIMVDHFDDNMLEIMYLKNILMCQMWFAEDLKHNNWNRLFALPQRTVEHCIKKYGEDWYESRQKLFKEKAGIE